MGMLQQAVGKFLPMYIITESLRYYMKYNLANFPYARQMNREAETNKGISVFLPKLLMLVLLEGKAN